MERLNIKLEEDRLAVASILVKNGYTVRLSKRKKLNGSRTYDYFLDYQRNQDELLGSAEDQAR